MDVGISDYQLIYWTRKPARIKSYCYKQITFRSTEIYEDALRKLSFPNYKLFDGIDEASEKCIQKVMAVIDILAPSKNKRIMGTSQHWFDVEIMEKISERDKLFKKFKTLACMSIKITTKKQGMRYKIRTKKKTYFENKLTENIGKPKELRKSLKYLGLKFEPSFSNINCLEKNKSVNFDLKYIAEDFSAYKYGMLSVAH